MGLLPLASSAGATDIRDLDALGDSFSTGQGLPGTQPPPCLPNSDAAYSAALARQLNLRLQLAACSGATTDSIRATQLSGLGPTTQVVTLTAGGNDVGVFPFIGLCIRADCAPALPVMLERIKTDLPLKLTALYQDITNRLGSDTTIVVGGYPVLMALRPTGSSDAVCSAFSPQERWAGAAIALTLDLVTRDSVADLKDTRFRYASALSPSSPFLGHGLCGTRAPYFFGSENRIAAFHPNELGVNAYEVIFRNALT
jgi:hypothetical protein